MTLGGLPVVDALRELLAGLEEEGCIGRVVRVEDTIDLGLIGLTAARLSGSGVGIGLQGKGTALIHRRDLPPLANLELYSVAPSVDAGAVPPARRQRRPARQGRDARAGAQPVQRRGHRGEVPHQGRGAGRDRAQLRARRRGARRAEGRAVSTPPFAGVGASGRDPAELTVEAVRDGLVDIADVRIHPATLEHQAQVAAAHANPQLAENFRRAAELALLPDDEVLALYEALRPFRSSADELDRACRPARRRRCRPQRRAVPRGRSGLPAARAAAPVSRA